MHPGLPLSKWESQVQTREVACLLLRLLPLHFGTQKDASLGKPHPSLCNKSLSIQVLFFFSSCCSQSGLDLTRVSDSQKSSCLQPCEYWDYKQAPSHLGMSQVFDPIYL